MKHELKKRNLKWSQSWIRLMQEISFPQHQQMVGHSLQKRMYKSEWCSTWLSYATICTSQSLATCSIAFYPPIVRIGQTLLTKFRRNCNVVFKIRQEAPDTQCRCCVDYDTAHSYSQQSFYESSAGRCFSLHHILTSVFLQWQSSADICHTLIRVIGGKLLPHRNASVDPTVWHVFQSYGEYVEKYLNNSCICPDKYFHETRFSFCLWLWEFIL